MLVIECTYTTSFPKVLESILTRDLPVAPAVMDQLASVIALLALRPPVPPQPGQSRWIGLTRALCHGLEGSLKMTQRLGLQEPGTEAPPSPATSVAPTLT